MAEDQNSKIKLIFADDIMTEEVVVINKNMLIGQVAHLMLRERVSGYPIVDQTGSVCGIVTLTDLFALVNDMVKDQWLDMGEKIKECKDRPIKDIMSTSVHVITPETPLSDIVNSVVKSNIHTFPVMKDNKLVGIIGRHDILNAVFVYG